MRVDQHHVMNIEQGSKQDASVGIGKGKKELLGMRRKEGDERRGERG